jgi:hypothetical protein
MAYDPNNLSALAYANGFTLWHYKTSDPAVVVDTIGYFNNATAMLRVGDFIMANTAGITQNGMFIVTTNDGTNVDTTNLIDFSSLDTD